MYYFLISNYAKIICSDFCGTELSEQKFAKRVARLNWNVLHLCFSQNVSPEILQPNHTLSNILHLLNTQVSDLGRYKFISVSPTYLLLWLSIFFICIFRQGPLYIDPMLAMSVEDQLQRDLAQASEDVDSCSEDESDALIHKEWENVSLLTTYIKFNNQLLIVLFFYLIDKTSFFFFVGSDIFCSRLPRDASGFCKPSLSTDEQPASHKYGGRTSY